MTTKNGTIAPNANAMLRGNLDTISSRIQTPLMILIITLKGTHPGFGSDPSPPIPLRPPQDDTLPSDDDLVFTGVNYAPVETHDDNVIAATYDSCRDEREMTKASAEDGKMTNAEATETVSLPKTHNVQVFLLPSSPSVNCAVVVPPSRAHAPSSSNAPGRGIFIFSVSFGA